MIKPISTTLQTLFADLVQKRYGAPTGGTVYTRERDGIEYYYAKIPVARTRIDSFIGKIGDPVAEAQVKRLREGLAEGRERRRTISILRSAGFATWDGFLGATLDAISHAGLFENGAVLVGTAAYTASEAHVGAFLPLPTLMTGDLDFATADLALSAEPPEPLVTILKRADPSFEAVMQLDSGRPSSRFRNSDGILVDVITPVRRRTDRNPMPLDALHAGAAPLQHVDWLIEHPLKTIALWGTGVPVAIPQTSRLAVHKLILAQSRDANDRLKRQKDLAQAGALIEALNLTDPFGLEDAFESARGQGPSWAAKIDRSLAELERSRPKRA
jgi:hypothetical protein